MERPAAYAFCFLTPAERNYAQIEEGEFSLDTESKEVPQLRYVYGRYFTLVTDHKPLAVLPRIERHAVIKRILPGCRYTSRYNGMPL